MLKMFSLAKNVQCVLDSLLSVKAASVCVEFVCRDNLPGNESGIGTGEQLSSFEKRQEKVRLHLYFVFCCVFMSYDNIWLQPAVAFDMCTVLVCILLD